MMLWRVFRFEFGYQMRQPWVWLTLAVLVVFAFFSTRVAILPVTLPKDFILNSPFIIASVSVFSCQIWLLLSPIIAGDAAARDISTGMYPLTYTSPISKRDYLGGRLLAAILLNAIVLLGVQVGSLLAAFGPGANPDIIGPFRPLAYLAAFCLIALPNVLVAITVQFWVALKTGKPLASYIGSVLLFFLSYPVTFFLYMSGLNERALLADPIGVMAIMNEMMSKWTIVEKNVRMFTLEGHMLFNRLLWIGISLVSLVILYLRFRFSHRTENDLLSQLRRLFSRPRATENILARPVAITVPPGRQSFSFTAHLRQAASVAGLSFRMIAGSPSGLFLLIVYPLFVVLVLLQETEQWGIPIMPRTGYILAKHLTAPLTYFSDFRVIIPLLIVYYTGELVWQERDARLSENVDATPVPEWALFLGKYLGLSLVLVAFMGSYTLAGMLAQTLNGYYNYEPLRYLQILLGLQLPEYLLFGALAFVVQAVVNQKHLGLLVTLVVYFLIIFAPYLGIQHKLLIYSASPEWYYTDIRGFGWSVGPWLWFKLYWAGWALLLAVVARLLWARGRDTNFKTRLRVARQRFNHSTAWFAALTAGVVLLLGGYIFYNTNILHEYITDEELVNLQAEYERKYGKFEGILQPVCVATKLNMELYPSQRAASIKGSYRLVNRGQEPIDSVHIEPAYRLKTEMAFDRPARLVLKDEKLGHNIYTLDEPLLPGDSLQLSFEVQVEPKGFSSTRTSAMAKPGRSGASRAVVENGTYLDAGVLPAIGYQPSRELTGANDRKEQGLPRQITLAELSDIDPNTAAGAGATFEAVIGTEAGQVAVAPGELLRSWSKGPRSYFHYASTVPIIGTELFFSADYEVHRERWKHVDIQLYVHPGHARHYNRLLNSARASLDYYSSQFGPYPHRFLQIVEQPGNFRGMGVDGSGVITGGEGYFLLDPQDEGFDAIFEIVAHEMGHQWWGMQLKPAFAEGGGVISESLAWYSAMMLVKKLKGREALRRFMSFMREPNPWPQFRTGLPLLRAMDPWANYRKGPFAMYALSEYVGEDRVNKALHDLVEKKASTYATTLDLYHELQAATPDSLKPLLHDLFEVNALWAFNTKQATVQKSAAGTWKVTLEVEAHKTMMDSAGTETEVPVNEWVEIGLFAAAQPGEFLGKPLYMQKHFIRSGVQTISVTLPHKPARGGIDPYNLLDWEEGDNIEGINDEQEKDD